MTNRIHSGAPIVAALAALLAVVAFAGPAAGAVGSVSTGSQVAEETTTHQFTVDAPQVGTLEGVELNYRSGVGLDDASVSVGVDRDGDGAVDDRLPTSDVRRGDRALAAGVGGLHNVTADDAVVVEVRGVRNPAEIGTHSAAVGATVDGATARSTVTYRVTPFRSDDTEFRAVAVPDSTFDRTYATGSTVADTRLVATDWRGVTLDDAVLEDVHGVDDAWNGVEFADTTATTLRTERTAFTGVTFSNAALSEVRSTGDAWRDVSVTDSALAGVDSRASTYRDVRFDGARVTDFAADSSTLENVSVRPAASGPTADGNRSDTSVSASNGSATAAFALDGPSPSDDAVDAAMARFRGTESAPAGTVSNVTVENATLRNVTAADSALVDVRVESATLRNVTLENVTLRGVTLSGDTYADGTLSDEVITSEAELRQELLVDEAAGAVSDGDVDAGASATPAERNATVDDGGLGDGADDATDGPLGS